METKRLVRHFELKKLEEDGTLTGYGSIFNVTDKGADIVAPGAFKRTLREHKKAGTLPAMLWQHRGDQPIGVYTAMKEDDHGLFLEGKLAIKTALGADAYELLKVKAVTGLSIGYSSIVAEYDDKKRVRTLKDVDLWEVSLVTFPMNPDARVSAVKASDADINKARRLLRKAIDLHQAHMDGTEPTDAESQAKLMRLIERAFEALGGSDDMGMGKSVATIRDFEDFLRDVGGFSNEAAKRIASLGFKAKPDPRDEAGEDMAAFMANLRKLSS